MALQQTIDRDVRDTHPDVAPAGAMGFADDVDLFGDGKRLLNNIVKYKAIIKDLTGMELCLNKCRLLVGSGIITQQLRDKADQHGIKIVTEGTTAMGAPVGTDQHIHADLHNRVRGLLHDVDALKYFSVHGQWTLLRIECA